jgi:hypothetical protein
MSRETWAVYSVRDHLSPYAFVTDVLLYDRIRVPVPTEDDLDRWDQQGWKPDRQARLLEVLGDRAQPLEWDEDLRERWKSSFLAASKAAQQTAPDAFKMTRRLLVESLPRQVTGVDTVCAYRGWSELQEDAQLTELAEPTRNPGLVAAAVAWDFAVPPQIEEEPVGMSQELEVLAAAIELSSRKDYRRNRRAYWRWAREFSSGTVTGQAAIDEAVEELEELVDEQHELVHQVWLDRAVRTGFLVGTVTLGLLAGPLTPVAVAGAALGLGQFTWGELRERPQLGNDRARVAEMFCQIDSRLRSEIFGPAR